METPYEAIMTPHVVQVQEKVLHVLFPGFLHQSTMRSDPHRTASAQPSHIPRKAGL